MKISQFVLNLSLVMVLAACTTVYTNGPMAIVESPEVTRTEKNRVSLDLGLKPMNNIDLVKDASSRPLTPNVPAVLGQRQTILGGLRLNQDSRLELGASMDPLMILMGGGFGGLLTAKYQLLGPTYDRFESHSHLLGISSHAVYYSQSLAGQQDGLFGPGGYPWSANSHFSGYDLGLSYGYRQSQQWLYYFGYAYQIFYADTNVNQTASSVGASPAYGAANFTLPAAQGANTRAALGAVLGGGSASRTTDASLDFQLAYITTSWNQQNLNEWSFSVSVIVPFSIRHSGDSKAEIKATTVPTPVETGNNWAPKSETTPTKESPAVEIKELPENPKGN